MQTTITTTLWSRIDKPEIQIWVKEESDSFSWSMKEPEKFMTRWYSCYATTPEGAACTGGGGIPANYRRAVWQKTNTS